MRAPGRAHRAAHPPCSAGRAVACMAARAAARRAAIATPGNMAADPNGFARSPTICAPPAPPRSAACWAMRPRLCSRHRPRKVRCRGQGTGRQKEKSKKTNRQPQATGQGPSSLPPPLRWTHPLQLPSMRPRPDPPTHPVTRPSRSTERRISGALRRDSPGSASVAIGTFHRPRGLDDGPCGP